MFRKLEISVVAIVILESGRRMKIKAVSGIMLALLLISMLTIYMGADGSVTVFASVCSVDITDIVTSHCGTPVDFGYTTWGASHPLVVDVMVHNNGTLRTNCTVNVYYQDGATWVQIGTAQGVTNLDPDNTATLTFNWGLTGLTQNTTYTLKANVTSTCGGSDEYTTTIFVRFYGDVDGNCKVNVMDMLAMKIIITILWVDPVADVPECDLDGNGKANVMDMLAMKLILTLLG
jgi:hypothetical protein